MAKFFAVAVAIAFAATLAQDEPGFPDISDFTKSPTEHIINYVPKPFVVRSVEGTIRLEAGRQKTIAGVLFEIQGPGSDRKITSAQTNKRGRFKIAGVRPGTYAFKATLNGFQSVVGRIIVSDAAPEAREIRVTLKVGM